MFDEDSGLVRKSYIPLVREYLKKYRYALEVSAEQLSRDLDISSVYYRQIEGGQRGKKLSIDIAYDLILYLKCDAIEFLEAEAAYLKSFEEMNRINSRRKYCNKINPSDLDN